MKAEPAFFDSNVVLYTISEDTPKSVRAEALMAGGGVISVQVLSEFVSVARRGAAFNWQEIDDAETVIRSLCTVIDVTPKIHDHARRIAERYGYHIYDAQMLAAAIAGDCETIWSEDMQHGQRIDGVLTIRNPFAP